MNILRTLRSRFAQVLVDFTDDLPTYASMVRPAQDSRFGDYQANCAMPLAKQQGANPRELALRIVDHLDIADLCAPPEIAGPGFINLTLRDDWLEQEINRVANDERLGVEAAKEPRTVVIDFSSPNVAKPMHVGHLRSTVIGDALARTIRFLGENVITDNHVGDWGTQFGMIICGYKNFVNPDAYAAHPVGELARLYRLVNQLSEYHNAVAKLPAQQDQLTALQATLDQQQASTAKEDKAGQKTLKKLRGDVDSLKGEIRSLESRIAAVEADPVLLAMANQHPDIARRARDETAKLHAGAEENLKLWNEFVPQCLTALQSVYDRLGITFDQALGESHYQDQLAGVVQELEAQGLAQESDGAICVFIPGVEAPFIVRKADGAFTYATTDLATIQARIQGLQADLILYVVDARQGEHFKLLFETARRWGFEGCGFHHVSFGTVMGPDGRPYKTRSGDAVGLESLLDEAVEKAYQIVSSNDDARTAPDGTPRPELDEAARKQIAEMVGIGGIKYADLQHNRESDYVFDSDKMLAMTGNTATYMQYAYARVQGIFRKGEVDVASLRKPGLPILLREPTERTLALQLCRYAETLEAVAEDCRPHILTQYLYQLANDLTSFYDQCPVLKADAEEVRVSRLRLCDLAGRVIAHGLGLLGIQTPSQM